MVYPKFIIEGDNLIISKCTYHKQLVCDKEQVKGGGWFKFDSDKKIYTLGGSSQDFGYAKLEDIKNSIIKNNVYSNRNLTKRISGYKFFYDTQTELIPLN